MTCRHLDRLDHTSPVVTAGAHVDPLPVDHPDGCRGCAPCDRRHCTVCTIHLELDELQTCIDCLGQARRDLNAILELAALLPAHALHAADHGHLAAAAPIPGADALVLLGRGSEGLAEDSSTQVELDPPSWTLGWWEEAIRERRGLDSRLPTWQRRADRTLVDAHAFLSEHLGWAAAHDPGFHSLAADLKRSRHQLEELLRAGDAPLAGVACFSCGATLERDYRPPTPCWHHFEAKANGLTLPQLWRRYPDVRREHEACDQGGLTSLDPHDGWACPRCHRAYSAGEYQLAVKARYDEVAEYRLLPDVLRLTGAKRGSVQGWATKGHVRRRRDDSGRVTYNVPDVRARLRLAAVKDTP